MRKSLFDLDPCELAGAKSAYGLRNHFLLSASCSNQQIREPVLSTSTLPIMNTGLPGSKREGGFQPPIAQS